MREEIPYSVLKRRVVCDAIKKVAPKCKGNFEIPMTAISVIEADNRLRKKPIRVSYAYVQNLAYEMFKMGLI